MKSSQDYMQKQKTNPLDVQKQQLANQQSQAMNPLLQAHQGLQNQGMRQNISQGGQNFAREGNEYDKFARTYGQPGQVPQGMPPTAQPMQGGPQGGQGDVFSQMGAPQYGPGVTPENMYQPTFMPGVQRGTSEPGMSPYSGQGAPWRAPWRAPQQGSW